MHTHTRAHIEQNERKHQEFECIVHNEKVESVCVYVCVRS